jgi:tRNA threonylcarbamoyladenosine biosynthesis protein TsaE
VSRSEVLPVGERPEATAEARRTSSAEETERLGEALARSLEIGDRLVLLGPLGSGKTRFVAGLARGLSAGARVRSPSFTLLHEYHGRLPLFHADLYRLESRDVAGLGLEEALERGVLVVEWGDRLPASFREDALTLEFELISDRERRMSARGDGPRGRALLAAWRSLS